MSIHVHIKSQRIRRDPCILFPRLAPSEARAVRGSRNWSAQALRRLVPEAQLRRHLLWDKTKKARLKEAWSHLAMLECPWVQEPE